MEKIKLNIGILAHVDAGKTTLSEALLYVTGAIRKIGRVDHKNTYLDNFDIERERGITVFSKQARFSTENCDFLLLDTPGHVDFSPETERAISLLDYAILVISGLDGVQNHTKTLWELLDFYSVPTYIFVNKMDISKKSKGELEAEISRELSPNCVPFDCDISARDEKLALIDESIMECVLDGKEIDDGYLSDLVLNRKLFPCVFGSALKLDGVDTLIKTVEKYSPEPIYPQKSFGAKIYKISTLGARQTLMKITGGRLCCRDEISYITPEGEKIREKIAQIRFYSGEKFEQRDFAVAGDIVSVIGLSKTYAGQGIGRELDEVAPRLLPVLSYAITLPSECDVRVYFKKLKELEAEEPSLHLYWNQELSQIEARLMGEVQIDLLKKMISDRFGISVSFDTGKILYKEKVQKRVIGVGHFEPLRHYSEVHLLLEPLKEGSGLVFDIKVPENSLDINWQRLIFTHLHEKAHKGVLIGAPLTDTKITLVAGKAHLKHTEGGDMREATYRAVRHGLMKGGCVLLEPYYKFRLELPQNFVGRAMGDLQAKFCEFKITQSVGDISIIEGRGPVSTLHDYTRELISYTRGAGRFSCTPDGYYPCHNQDEVVTRHSYSPENDIYNPPHSVFCAHGAGFVVPWDKVDEYKHLDSGYALTNSSIESMLPRPSKISKKYNIDEKELEGIMLREFGPIKRRVYSEPKVVCSAESRKKYEPKPQKLIIDGYNYIYSIDELKEIANFSLQKAREALMDLLSSYVAYTKCDLILVFDAYLVQENQGSEILHDGYKVIYTRSDVTADAYIEKLMSELGPDYDIKVVTGDKLLQFSAVHSGILRMTAKEFYEEIQKISNEIHAFIMKLNENE